MRAAKRRAFVMNLLLKKAAAVLILAMVSHPVFGALTVTSSANANNLAGRLVASAGGISVTAAAVTVPGNGLIPTGLFQGGPFGIIDGIIITNGLATNALPPNVSSSMSADLAIVYAGTLVNDILGRTVNARDTVILSLTFDVESWVNSVSFDFIFGSEEYSEYVGDEYFDLFGAFLNGTQIVFDQFGEPITINGPFFSTSLVKTPPANGMEYDGSTSVFVTRAPVLPGSTGNTIQFVISDIKDHIYDSGALLANFRGLSENVETPVTGLYTPTATVTKTSTVSPTITRTHTITPTHSITETHTNSPTITETHTITPTHTITDTHTATPTITETSTITMTHTITPTVTPTLTRTPTPTATNTPVPFVMSLEGNFPNPFERDTQIVYWLSREAEINLKVFTVSGEVVREIKGIAGLKGNNSLYFDGRNKRDKPLASGVYIYKITGRTEKNESASFTSKMSVVK